MLKQYVHRECFVNHTVYFSFDDPDQAENDYASSNDGGFESGNSIKTPSNLEQELLSSD